MRNDEQTKPFEEEDEHTMYLGKRHEREGFGRSIRVLEK